MISLQTRPDPVHLWLAAAGPHGGGAPAEQGDAQNVQTRSLRVLIVEDEFYISLHTRRLLQAMGHVVGADAGSADRAGGIAERERPGVVLSDVRLVGSRDGIDAAHELSQRSGIGSLVVAATAHPQTRRRAETVRSLGFLEKPLT